MQEPSARREVTRVARAALFAACVACDVAPVMCAGG